MDIAKEIKKILVDEDMNISELAKRLNTTQPNISAKLKRNDLRISELDNIADVLNYELKIIFEKKKS